MHIVLLGCEGGAYDGFRAALQALSSDGYSFEACERAALEQATIQRPQLLIFGDAVGPEEVASALDVLAHADPLQACVAWIAAGETRWQELQQQGVQWGADMVVWREVTPGELSFELEGAKEILQLRTAALRRSCRAFQERKMAALRRACWAVSHDMNNALSAIQGYADLGAMRPDLDPQLKKYFTQIQMAAEKSALLSRQLQAFCSEQGAALPAVDVNAVLEKLAVPLRQAAGAGVECSIRTAPVPLCRLDGSRLEEALLCLVRNAAEAMPGGGMLTIRTADADGASVPSAPRGKRWVAIHVTDTGEGMDAAMQARAFEPFYSTRKRKGAGLGLPMVYGAVRQAGGRVALESKPGKGTTVSLYFEAAER